MLVPGVPVVQRDEVERVVGRRDHAHQAEARAARVILYARFRLEDRVEPLVDRRGAVERGGHRKLDVGKYVALVLLRDETGWKPDGEEARHGRRGEQQEYCEGSLADQEATPVEISAHHPLEGAIE